MRGRLYTWLHQYYQQRLSQGHSGPLHVAAYWALEMEPDLGPLLVRLEDEAEFKLSLPTIVTPDAPLVFRPWVSSTPMKKGLFAIQEPDTTAEAGVPDVVLVPTLAFTRQGERLGYGKGYYDRTLTQLKAQNPALFALGIAWAVGDLSAYNYQAAPHDVPLNAILTDKGWPYAQPLS